MSLLLERCFPCDLRTLDRIDFQEEALDSLGRREGRTVANVMWARKLAKSVCYSA